jgi:hypothetical protein
MNARIYMVLFICAFRGSVSMAEPFEFVLCEETNNHIAVCAHEDHFVVHCHVRIQGFAQSKVFARVRSEVQDVADETYPSFQTTREVLPKSDNEVWSFYFQIPRYSEPDVQKRAVYQLEFGPIAPTEVNDYPIYLPFAWNLRPNGDGWDMTIEGAHIPILVRSAIVEGENVKFAYEQTYGAAEIDLQYGIAKLDVGKIFASRAVRLIEEPR